jgi:hypothetical protein
MDSHGFDGLAKALGRTTSRREALRLLSAAAAGGLLSLIGCAPSGSIVDPECEAGTVSCQGVCCDHGESCFGGACTPVATDICLGASRCGERHYCNDAETCMCIESVEGDMRCGQLPNTCYLPICETSADCAYLGVGYFCDTPDSGCCSDPPAHLSRCIAPCGAPPCPEAYLCGEACCAEGERCLGGACLTCADEDVCGSTCCGEGQTCVDGACVQTETTLVLGASSEATNLLFVVRHRLGTVYYQGDVAGGEMAATFATVELPGALASPIIFDDDYLPIQWIAQGLSVEVRRPPGSTFDPHQARHLIAADGGRRVETLDIVPGDLTDVVDRMEAQTGETFEGARRLLQSLPDLTYGQLLALAKTPGADQPRFIAAAMGFATASAALQLAGVLAEVEATRGSVGRSSLKGKVAEKAVDMGKAVLGGVIGDALSPKTPEDPSVPTVDVLLCQGTSMIPQVCHYMFFLNEGFAFPCVDICFASLECFTDICQPTTFAADDVNTFRGKF